jgi:hypothetical protein
MTPTLDPKKPYIILFTRGRINKQKSLSYFSKSMILDTIVVTIKSELEGLKAKLAELGIEPLKFVSFPDEYRLNLKRYLMAKWVDDRGGRRFMFCDDDVSLTALVDDKYKSTRTPEGKKALSKHWSHIGDLFKKYHGVGVSANSRNNRNYFNEKHEKDGFYVQENTKSACFFGYRTKTFLSSFQWAYDSKILQNMAYIDLMSNLMAIREDRKIVRMYDISWATKFDDKKTSGGMNAYRTHKTNDLAFFLLLLFIPGSFTRKPVRTVFDILKINRSAWTPKTSWKEHHFDWDSWYTQIVAEYKSQTKEKKLSELFDHPEAVALVRHLLKKYRAMRVSETKLQLGSVTKLFLAGGKEKSADPVAKALVLAESGVPVRVELMDERPTKVDKEIKLTIDRLVITNWLKINKE